MMTQEFQFRGKIPVVVLGATGSVGQRFVEMLSKHLWFEIVAVAASERSAGRKYGEVVNWLMPTALPSHIANMVVSPCDPSIAASIAFSGLDAEVAGEIEIKFAKAGFAVVSNARNHRMEETVPLLIPEVNSDHLDLVRYQKFGKGKIVTNPNCSTIGLSLALKPLDDLFGIESLSVVTLQAVSGAGYPGVASLDILDNVVPYIGGEELKMETEPLKILGKLIDGKISYSSMKISAHCNRVPVSDGHLECVSVKFKQKPEQEQIIQAWNNFLGEPQHLHLPTAPVKPIHYFSQDHFPQPKRHRELDKGMAVSVGRLRHCPLLDYKFALLSHNTIRGAAGGAILNAELMVKKGLIFWGG